MEVKIIKPGVYMDANLRAKTCQAGDLLDTREWYAKTLIENGCAQVIPVNTAKPAKKTAGKKSGKKSAKPADAPATAAANPFLE